MLELFEFLAKRKNVLEESVCKVDEILGVVPGHRNMNVVRGFVAYDAKSVGPIEKPMLDYAGVFQAFQ